MTQDRIGILWQHRVVKMATEEPELLAQSYMIEWHMKYQQLRFRGLGVEPGLRAYMHDARLRRRTPHGFVNIDRLLRMWHVREMVRIICSVQRFEAVYNVIDAVCLTFATISLQTHGGVDQRLCQVRRFNQLKLRSPRLIRADPSRFRTGRVSVASAILSTMAKRSFLTTMSWLAPRHDSFLDCKNGSVKPWWSAGVRFLSRSFTGLSPGRRYLRVCLNLQTDRLLDRNRWPRKGGQFKNSANERPPLIAPPLQIDLAKNP